jgi:cytochrome oxidase assembly protein ShyY1
VSVEQREVTGEARDPAPPTFWRTALTPRMMVLLLLFLAIAAVCARLGVWQLDRALERGAQNEAARSAERAAAPAETLDDVLRPQETFTGDLVGRKVVASGAFEVETLLVPGRAHDGVTGYLVLDALRVEEADALLPVVRGWVAEPEAPAPAAGPVRVEGFLQSGDAAEPGTFPAGQVGAVSPAQLVNLWGGPMYAGYLVVSQETDPQVAVLRPPVVPGGGLNLQNLAYALQWWIFGGFVVLLWTRFVRDEARAVAEEESEAAA